MKRGQPNAFISNSLHAGQDNHISTSLFFPRPRHAPIQTFIIIHVALLPASQPPSSPPSPVQPPSPSPCLRLPVPSSPPSLVPPALPFPRTIGSCMRTNCSAVTLTSAGDAGRGDVIQSLLLDCACVVPLLCRGRGVKERYGTGKAWGKLVARLGWGVQGVGRSSCYRACAI